MGNLNLVVKFKLVGDGQFRVKGIARMKVDGCGGLMLYGLEDEGAERIELRNLESLGIHSMTRPQVVAA